MIENIKIERAEKDSPTAKQEKGKGERKQNVDMKSFWKYTDENFFKNANEANLDKINHVVMNLSAYDIKNDSSLIKYGFPKNLDTFASKPYDLALKQNNPLLVTKYFGMYLYIDKYDYLINNTNSGEISDEIEELENRLDDLELSNLDYFDRIKQSMRFEKEKQKVDLASPEVNNTRMENICNQILSLQIKQLAECISSIKKDPKGKNYIVVFDKAENIPNLLLDEPTFKNLLKQRDTLNSISVYDLFQEKITSVYTNNTKNATEKARRGKKTKNSKGSKDDNNISIASNIHISFEFCHHCKQKKPVDIMLRCESHHFQTSHIIKNFEKSFRYCTINGVITTRKFLSYIISNFTGDPRELIDEHLSANYKHDCKRYFCNYCLKGNYEINVEQIKSKKEWMCPWCEGACFCTRCKRTDQILKLISTFLGMGGNLNQLEEYMVANSKVIPYVIDSLQISNLVIINHNINNTSVIKKPLAISKADNKKKPLENFLDDRDIKNFEQTKDQLSNLQEFFSNIFHQNKDNKALQVFDKKMDSIGRGKDERNNSVFLKKKKKRNEYGVGIYSKAHNNGGNSTSKALETLWSERIKRIKRRKNNIKLCLRMYSRKNLRIKRLKDLGHHIIGSKKYYSF